MINPEHFAVTLARAVELVHYQPKAVDQQKASLRALVGLCKLGAVRVARDGDTLTVLDSVISMGLPAVPSLVMQLRTHRIREITTDDGAQAADLLRLMRGLAESPEEVHWPQDVTVRVVTEAVAPEQQPEKQEAAARRMTAKVGRRRAAFVRLDLEPLWGNRCCATVKLALQGQDYVGRAEGSGLDREARCAAEATGDALRHLVGTERSAFEVRDLQSLTVLEVPAVIVLLSARWQNESQTLAGFSLTRKDDPPHAAIRAVLSSTNRFLERLWDA